MMNESESLDEILRLAILLKNKKGKKLEHESICYQFYFSSSQLSIHIVCGVVKFFIELEGLRPDRKGFLGAFYVWTPARRRLLDAMIKGLKNKRVREQVFSKIESLFAPNRW